MREDSGHQIITEIRRKHKIPEYLAAKGFIPRKISGERLSYICPLPGHQDTFPSFYVWLKEDELNHQYYHCFGCHDKNHGDIITLYSELEGITWQEAIKRLGEGINITSESELSYLIDLLKKRY